MGSRNFGFIGTELKLFKLDIGGEKKNSLPAFISFKSSPDTFIPDR